MIEFLKQQLQRVEEKLQELIADRSLAGIGTAGDYEIQIKKLKQERERLMDEIRTEERIASYSRTSTDQSQSPEQKVEDAADAIRQLVARGKLKEAIQYLGRHYQSDEASLLSGRLEKIKRESRLGIISRSEETLEFNRIANSILEALSEG